MAAPNGTRYSGTDATPAEGPWSPPAYLGIDRKTFMRILRREPCSYCSRRLSGTVDHVVPRSQGARSRADDLTAACPLCNSEKGVLSLLLFLLARRDELQAEGSR
jgi:hypothetical protein